MKHQDKVGEWHAKANREVDLIVQLEGDIVKSCGSAITALFMTVWHCRSRNAESSCGIRQG